MGPIARRSITARYALASLVARVIRISVALLFSIAKATRSARPVQPATEAYAQVNR
jgi:nitrogen fixation/metabolism regulation signal transduction histidine kinase